MTVILIYLRSEVSSRSDEFDSEPANTRECRQKKEMPRRDIDCCWTKVCLWCWRKLLHRSCSAAWVSTHWEMKRLIHSYLHRAMNLQLIIFIIHRKMCFWFRLRLKLLEIRKFQCGNKTDFHKWVWLTTSTKWYKVFGVQDFQLKDIVDEVAFNRQYTIWIEGWFANLSLHMISFSEVLMD